VIKQLAKERDDLRNAVKKAEVDKHDLQFVVKQREAERGNLRDVVKQREAEWDAARRESAVKSRYPMCLGIIIPHINSANADAENGAVGSGERRWNRRATQTEEVPLARHTLKDALPEYSDA
jgi:hypothetical protein